MSKNCIVGIKFEDMFTPTEWVVGWAKSKEVEKQWLDHLVWLYVETTKDGSASTFASELKKFDPLYPGGQVIYAVKELKEDASWEQRRVLHPLVHVVLGIDKATNDVTAIREFRSRYEAEFLRNTLTDFNQLYLEVDGQSDSAIKQFAVKLGRGIIGKDATYSVVTSEYQEDGLLQI